MRVVVAVRLVVLRACSAMTFRATTVCCVFAETTYTGRCPGLTKQSFILVCMFKYFTGVKTTSYLSLFSSPGRTDEDTLPPSGRTQELLIPFTFTDHMNVK